ncbi:MAG TPA: hypothetical protein VGS22_20980 [Thermoanaerobaculia bacterium]|nr:hypothetical protein [Thermoanaerobaculia bacterium]
MKTPTYLLLAGLSVAATLVLACGKNSESPTGPPPPNQQITRSNVIAALFLGEGPLRSPQGTPCPNTGFWRAFPRGSRLRVRLSTALSTGERNTVEGFLSDFRGLVAGTFDLAIETTTQEDPIPGFLEVTVTSLSNSAVDARCPPGSGGCTKITLQAPGVLASSRTVARHQFGGNVHDHELGHGILGLCHVDGFVMPDALMATPGSGSIGNFNTAERQAIQAVMRSGLSAGATRADFERLGLVDPAGTSGASSSPAFGTVGGADDPPIRWPDRRESGGAAGRERERQ